MKNSQLNRVLSLIRHTGDRIVVMDPKNDDIVVLMPVNEYESLIGAKKTEPTLRENMKCDMDWDEDEDEDEDKSEEEMEMEEDLGEPRFTTPPHLRTNHLSNNASAKQRDPWTEEKTFDYKNNTRPESTTFVSPTTPEEGLNFDDYDWSKEEGVSLNEEELHDIPEEEEEEEKFYLEPIE